MTQDEEFKAWWYSEGSQAPYTHHDCEEHTMRMCEIAWANGAYKEREALAQPKQEPVAYINVEERKLEWAKPMNWNTPTVVKLERIPLYTKDGTPAWRIESSCSKTALMRMSSLPHRTWVGLTDDEMEATFIECGGKWYGDFWKIEDADFHPFLRTIEAKLKQKNGYAEEKQA